MRTGLRACFEDRMVNRTRAGIEGHINFMLLEELPQMDRVRRIDLMNDKAAFLGAFVKNVGKGGVDIGQDDALEAIISMKIQANHRAHSTDSVDHRVCPN